MINWKSRTNRLQSGRVLTVWHAEYNGATLVIHHATDGPFFWRAARGGSWVMNSTDTFQDARMAAGRTADEWARLDEEWPGEAELTLEAMRAELAGGGE